MSHKKTAVRSDERNTRRAGRTKATSNAAGKNAAPRAEKTRAGRPVRHAAKPASANLIQRRVGATQRDRRVVAKVLRELDL